MGDLKEKSKQSFIYVRDAKSIKNVLEDDISAFKKEIENTASIFLDNDAPHSHREIYKEAHRDDLTFYWYLRGHEIAQQLQSFMGMYIADWQVVPIRFTNTLALMQNAKRDKLKDDEIEHKIVFKIVSDNIFTFIYTYKRLVVYREVLNAYKDVYSIKYLDGLIDKLDTTVKQLKDRFKEYNETVTRFYLGVFPKVAMRKDMYKKDKDKIKKDFIKDVNIASDNFFNLVARYRDAVNIKLCEIDKA